MRLSEAIRLGAMMKPQGFGKVLEDGKTCAYGAAFDAMGILDQWSSLYKACLMGNMVNWTEWWSQWWKEVRAVFTVCPSCGAVSAMNDMIVHLNDTHRWDRERIASFIEVEENKLERETEQAKEYARQQEETVGAGVS